VVEDVSDRKRLEEEIVQSQKMRAIGQLAGGVAHDFNNLLTTILGYTELLQRRLSPEDPLRALRGRSRQRGGAGERAHETAPRVRRKQMLRPLPIDLNEVVREMDALLRHMIGDSITLQIDLDPALGTVNADPGQIGQVLMNLVGNARDAMPAGGAVGIETGNVEIGEAAGLGDRWTRARRVL
jgi:two-component system cell cycle sensor histidine kinase/response regulator CckA